VRVAFNGRFPAPPTIRAHRRIRADKDMVYYGMFESLRVLGCTYGLCDTRVVGRLPDSPVPTMFLKYAGRVNGVQYDHDSLYVRIAIDLLLGDLPGAWPVDPERGRRVAMLIQSVLNWKYAPEGARYMVLSEPTAYARLEAYGRHDMSNRRCREWYSSWYGEPPLTLEEAIEELRRAPCRAYAVRVKDVAKFSILAAIGWTKHTTGLWRFVVAWGRVIVYESVKWLAEHGVDVYRGYVDSYHLSDKIGKTPPWWRRYPVKLEAEGDGIVVLPPLYRVGSKYGLWGVWEADGKPPRIPVHRGGDPATVYYTPDENEWYRRARGILDGRVRPDTGVLVKVSATARRYGVVVGWRDGVGLTVRDTRPGVLREWDSRERYVYVLGRGVEVRTR